MVCQTGRYDAQTIQEICQANQLLEFAQREAKCLDAMVVEIVAGMH